MELVHRETIDSYEYKCWGLKKWFRIINLFNSHLRQNLWYICLSRTFYFVRSLKKRVCVHITCTTNFDSMFACSVANNTEISYLQKYKYKIFRILNDTDCDTLVQHIDFKSFSDTTKSWCVLEWDGNNGNSSKAFVVFNSTSKWLCDFMFNLYTVQPLPVKILSQ